MRKSLNNIIKRGLNRERARYLTPNKNWYLIMPHLPIRINGRYIHIKFSKKKGTKSIKLAYPFKISNTTAYMYGLILGSARKKADRLILHLDHRQVSKIKNFCRQFNLRPRIKIISKRTKNRNKQVYNHYFKSAIVKIPSPIYQYMKALGLNLFLPKIPSYFSPKLKHLVISGYLNSKKTTIIHHSTTPLNQWIQIKAKSKPFRVDYASKFIKQIYKDLKYHSIKVKVGIGKFNSKIQIKNQFIARILKKYHIRRPQIRFSGKMAALIKKYPHILKTINLYGLNSFQLSVLEIAFYHFYKRKYNEIEYTRIEEMLCCSSNMIRQCLYDFQERGLLQYFVKGRKEFLKATFLCFKYAGDHLKNTAKELNNSLRHSDNISFVCMECGKRFDYLSALEGGNFHCPYCHSTRLSEYSKQKLKRRLNAYNGQLHKFEHSFKVMCYA